MPVSSVPSQQINARSRHLQTETEAGQRPELVLEPLPEPEPEREPEPEPESDLKTGNGYREKGGNGILEKVGIGSWKVLNKNRNKSRKWRICVSNRMVM